MSGININSEAKAEESQYLVANMLNHCDGGTSPP